MFHTIVIAGSLGKDATMRYTPSGKAVTSFSVAVSDGFGENKKTIWINVSVWDKAAETCKDLLKGAKVLVEGRIIHENGSPRIYKKQDGSSGAGFEISASTVRFLSAKGESQSEPEMDF